MLVSVPHNVCRSRGGVERSAIQQSVQCSQCPRCGGVLTIYLCVIIQLDVEEFVSVRVFESKIEGSFASERSSCARHVLKLLFNTEMHALAPT